MTRRAIAVRIGGEPRWIAVEDTGRYRDATGAQPPPGDAVARVPRRDERRPRRAPRALGAHARAVSHGRPSRAGACRRGSWAEALARLVGAAGSSAASSARAARTGSGAIPEVLRLLRRRSLARLRREVEPVEHSALARFLPAWQGVAAVAGAGPAAERPPPLRGQAALERLAEVVDQLAGVPIPASVLERDVLPARVRRLPAAASR